jgi:hypothetical protein
VGDEMPFVIDFWVAVCDLKIGDAKALARVKDALRQVEAIEDVDQETVESMKEWMRDNL